MVANHSPLGSNDGIELGSLDGIRLGFIEGFTDIDGIKEGKFEGWSLGTVLGNTDGLSDGIIDGYLVSWIDPSQIQHAWYTDLSPAYTYFSTL